MAYKSNHKAESHGKLSTFSYFCHQLSLIFFIYSDMYKENSFKIEKPFVKQVKYYLTGRLRQAALVWSSLIISTSEFPLVGGDSIGAWAVILMQKTAETAGTEWGTRPGSVAVKLRRDLGTARGVHPHLFFSSVLATLVCPVLGEAFPTKAGRKGPAPKIFCLK